ncbi:hypothetical protein KA005_47815, partial [bacterium]|nr:hypothetical protein [bacterium]
MPAFAPGTENKIRDFMNNTSSVVYKNPLDLTTDASMMDCFTFGKSARHTVSNGFATKIDKKEALKILKEAESAGLIHKAFHPASKESKPETSICNCCKDCCDVFRLWREGTLMWFNLNG